MCRETPNRKFCPRWFVGFTHALCLWAALSRLEHWNRFGTSTKGCLRCYLSQLKFQCSFIFSRQCRFWSGFRRWFWWVPVGSGSGEGPRKDGFRGEAFQNSKKKLCIKATSLGVSFGSCLFNQGFFGENHGKPKDLGIIHNSWTKPLVNTMLWGWTSMNPS